MAVEYFRICNLRKVNNHGHVREHPDDPSTLIKAMCYGDGVPERVFLAINELRALCPNFMLTRGMGKDEHGEQILFMERVEGTTLQHWMNGASRSDLTIVVSQMILALALAYEKIGLVHGDLHKANVIVYPCEAKTLTYIVGGKTYSLATRWIAVFIDLDDVILDKRIDERVQYIDLLAWFTNGMPTPWSDFHIDLSLIFNEEDMPYEAPPWSHVARKYLSHLAVC